MELEILDKVKAILGHAPVYEDVVTKAKTIRLSYLSEDMINQVCQLLYFKVNTSEKAANSCVKNEGSTAFSKIIDLLQRYYMPQNNFNIDYQLACWFVLATYYLYPGIDDRQKVSAFADQVRSWLPY